MRERIARHRAERPASWITVEEPIDLRGALAGGAGNGRGRLPLALGGEPVRGGLDGRGRRGRRRRRGGCGRRPRGADVRGLQRGRARHRAGDPARPALPRRARARERELGRRSRACSARRRAAASWSSTVREVRAAWDAKTKPRGSLGRLEDLAVRVAEIRGTATPGRLRAVVVVAAADHGVAAQGVSAYPSEVTAQMLANFEGGGAAVCVLARLAGAELRVFDLGVGAGTDDMTAGPAMSPEQARRLPRGGTPGRSRSRRGRIRHRRRRRDGHRQHDLRVRDRRGAARCRAGGGVAAAVPASTTRASAARRRSSRGRSTAKSSAAARRCSPRSAGSRSGSSPA